MTDYVHASPSLRAWYRFKSNKRGYYSLWVFGILFVLSLFAEVISNDEPLIVYFDGEYYFPVFKAYPETTFGGDFETGAIVLRKLHDYQKKIS